VRDFIKTREGLIFSVVSYYHPNDRYIAFLRYYPNEEGERESEGVKYKKVTSTAESFKFLKENFPEYLSYSEIADAMLQCVPVSSVLKIYYPWKRLKEVIVNPQSPYESKVAKLSKIFGEIPTEKKGVTGSFLVNLHSNTSDIDFVIYGSKNFQKARKILKKSLEVGVVREPSEEEWLKSYEKRFPGKKPISFEEYCFHEKRKLHRGVIDGTIFDILFVRDYEEIREKHLYKKCRRRGKATVACTVTDSSLAFDYPSIYRVKCSAIPIREVSSYTHTYAGQARTGETIEACGWIEEVEVRGGKNYYRLVVGTTREAEDEYIKIIK
jgi:hypothetical protein